MILKYLSLLVCLLTINSCSIGKEGAVLFPFFNGLYTYSDGTIKKVLSTPYQFSKTFFRHGQNTYVLDTRTKQILVIDTDNQIRPVFEKQKFSKFFQNQKALLTISDTFSQDGNDLGFEYSLYPIVSNTPMSNPIARFHLDFFISDYAVSDDGFFLAGMDAEDRIKTVYWFEASSGKTEVLFQTTKRSDFLKLILHQNLLIIYSSVADFTNRDATLWIYNTQSGSLKEKALDLKSEYCFYGKGFSWHKFVVLPLLNARRDTAILILNPDKLEPIRIQAISSGLYAPVYEGDSRFLYSGYHYYQNPSQFHLIDFHLDKGELKFRTVVIPKE